MKIFARLLPVALFAPMLALAANPGNLSGVNTFILNVMNFINTVLVPAIFGLAFLVFLWGMFKTFILGGGDEEKQTEGKQLMVYAIAGFVIMISVWGIVNVLSSSLGFSGDSLQQIPNVPKR
ncbi:MAG: pilin [Candidatus Pacebacteria bacterium]|nr:pilin [Candidatus Paceibacterota bacterium]MCF7857295.1 pilin [Candidatus Paceibacterota bacterium]